MMGYKGIKSVSIEQEMPASNAEKRQVFGDIERNFRIKRRIKKNPQITEMDVVLAHSSSANNRPDLIEDDLCGCFCCGKVFSTSLIRHWIFSRFDSMGTATCPFCGCDSVIGESSGYPVTEEFMKLMGQYWFAQMSMEKLGKAIAAEAW